jgi:hypothetical protein
VSGMYRGQRRAARWGGGTFVENWGDGPVGRWGVGASGTRTHSNGHFYARRQDRAFWQTAVGKTQPQVRQPGGMPCLV